MTYSVHRRVPDLPACLRSSEKIRRSPYWKPGGEAPPTGDQPRRTLRQTAGHIQRGGTGSIYRVEYRKWLPGKADCAAKPAAALRLACLDAFNWRHTFSGRTNAGPHGGGQADNPSCSVFLQSSLFFRRETRYYAGLVSLNSYLFLLGSCQSACPNRYDGAYGAQSSHGRARQPRPDAARSIPSMRAPRRKRPRGRHPTQQPPDTDIDPTPISDFSNWVNETKQLYTGKDVAENSPNYIPPNVLQEYWNRRRVYRVMQAPRNHSLSFDIDTIRREYIRTFSTLVISGRIESLGSFTGWHLDDARLPLEAPPEEWPKDPFHQRLFADICEHQWVFFPFVFAPDQLQDRRLDNRRVLPIESIEDIVHGDAAVIRKITIHDSCNNLVPKVSLQSKSRPTQRVFVLKSYHSHKFEHLYLNEIKALVGLKNCPSPHVITFYGSFRQHGSYNLILEYADGGNLADFFRNTPLPKGSDVGRFWKSLSATLQGIDRVHQLMIVGDKALNGYVSLGPRLPGCPTNVA